MKPAYEHIIKMQEIRENKDKRNKRILDCLIAAVIGTAFGMMVGYLI
ncbi:MAG: hypothetical protein KA807_20700 [Prolixibacteraceae bacterium]|nr:hypothetical protein [Prolixibacteraceae bacterium]